MNEYLIELMCIFAIMVWLIRRYPFARLSAVFLENGNSSSLGSFRKREGESHIDHTVHVSYFKHGSSGAEDGLGTPDEDYDYKALRKRSLKHGDRARLREMERKITLLLIQRLRIVPSAGKPRMSPLKMKRLFKILSLLREGTYLSLKQLRLQNVNMSPPA